MLYYSMYYRYIKNIYYLHIAKKTSTFHKCSVTKKKELSIFFLSKSPSHKTLTQFFEPLNKYCIEKKPHK